MSTTTQIHDYKKIIAPGRTFTGNLSGANFSRGKLSGAIFENADLTKAVFSLTDLEKAQFKGCVLIETDFSGADMEGVIIDEDCTVDIDLTKTSLLNLTLPQIIGRIRDKTAEIAESHGIAEVHRYA